MNTSPNHNWLSAHLYYAEPWEPFLLNAVLPLVSQLLETQSIHQYFFIRYWEKGPHIRLRLELNKVEATDIQELVSAHFLDYFKQNPSDRILTPEMEKAKIANEWEENNSIKFEKYIPEITRYGGELALPLAHLQFFTATQVVLEHLRHAETWSYDDALGVAIKLNVTFAKAMKMPLDEAVLFFEMIFQNWLSRALPSEALAENFTTHQEAVLLQFDKSYEVQKAAVLPYISSIWNIDAPNEATDLSGMAHWWQTHQFIADNLLRLDHQSLLTSRAPADRYQSIPGVPDIQLDRWSIYADYLHLTNNRLGILNRDEPFLSYLITRSLKNMG